MPLALPPLSPLFAAFGVAATVTPAGGAPVAVTVAWVSTRPQVGGDQDPVNLRPRLAVRRAEVEALSPGSVIVAPRATGQVPETWVVDRVDNDDPELISVVVR